MSNIDYVYKYEKYLKKYLEACGGGIYKPSCSRNEGGTKLNKSGLSKYLDYKKGSCQDLDWDNNSCDSTNDKDEIRDISNQYLQCAEDRESFSEDCVVSIDSNHQHAIDKMKWYHKQCEEKMDT